MPCHFLASMKSMKTEVDVFQFKAGVDFLKSVYMCMRENNPRFSRRAFAVKLGMDQSMLARYFGGVRLLASERVEEVARRLELTKLESQYFKVISLLGDRGEMDVLEKLRLSLRGQSPFDMSQVVSALHEAGWWQIKGSDLRLKVLRRIFSMVSNVSTEAGTSSETITKTITEKIQDTQVEINSQILCIRKEDRKVIEKSLQELYGLLNSAQAEDGDDFLVISSAHIKSLS